MYRWAQLDYERHEVEAGSDSDAVGGSAVLHWAGMTDSLPTRPAVVLTALPAVPDGRSLRSILDEYLDRATTLARLQAQLDDTTDPAMRQYLQGLIDVEQNILNDLATQATAAGATSSDLSDIDAQAQAAANSNPIDLQTLDDFNDVYVDSSAPGYWYFLTNPSAMNDDLQLWHNFSTGTAIGAGSALIIVIAAPVVVAAGTAGLTAVGVSSTTATTVSTGAVTAGLFASGIGGLFALGTTSFDAW